MRKFTLAFVSMLFSLGAIAETVTVYGVGAQLSSSELNGKTESTMIAIKNLSRTNNYYYVGNTGAAPYSKAAFDEAAVFVWEPVTEGTPGSYYLRKLNGDYMQNTSPKDFGTVTNAAVFTTTNPTSTGSGSTKFNSDGDSQAYINGNDDPNLVRFVNGNSKWINVQNGDSGTPTYNSGEGGWTIHYVYAVTSEEVSHEQLTYYLTDEAGNVYEGSYEATVGTEPTFTGVAGYTLEGEWNENSFVGSITFPFPVSSAEVTNETLISSFQKANLTYRWYADGDYISTKENVLPSLSNLNSHLWAIYPTCNEGAFTFTIKNVGTGKYVHSTSNSDSHNAGVVSLAEQGSDMTYDASGFKLSTGKYLSLNSSNKGTGVHQYVGTYSAHDGTKLSFPTLNAYTVDITDAKAATLTTPFAVSLPDGVTAGYVSGVDTEKQTLVYTDVTTIPAGESVVLFGEAGTYTFNKVAEAEAFGINYLVGYSEATEITEGPVYALANKNDVVAFYLFEGTQYAAGKAYLQLPEATEVAMFSLTRGDEEDTTNIEMTTDNGQQSTVIYDLAGRRVEKMEKGIYIVNGKKVIR